MKHIKHVLGCSPSLGTYKALKNLAKDTMKPITGTSYIKTVLKNGKESISVVT
jgi:hypothetical protein